MEQSCKGAFMHNWHKAIIFLGVAVCFFSSPTMHAQIKIVGADYADSLTGSKSYYNKDVDFDKLFPSANNIEYCMLSPYWSNFNYHGEPLKSPFWEVNLSGDTVYLTEDVWIESFPSSTIQNMYSREGDPIVNDFCVDNFGIPQNRKMTQGYYEITGYVFCSDNGDSIRSSYKLKQPQYLYFRRWELLDNEWKYSKKRRDETTKALKDNILAGEVGDISDYIMYIIFRPLESSDTVEYYISYYDRYYRSDAMNRRDGETSIIHKMMPLRFYNMANSYIGKEVVLFKQELTNTNVINTLIKDSISDRLIKIQDGVFVVKDVVMKDNHYYAILVGPKTGSFAFPLNIIIGTNTIEHSIPDYTHIWWHWKEEVKEGRMGGDVLYLVGDDNLGVIKKQDLEMMRKRRLTAKSQLEKERKQQEQRSKLDKEKKEAAFKQQMQTKHGERFGNLVANKQVTIEMTKAMVSDAWGKPMNIYRTTTKYGQSEVWCYNYKTRVYLYNGKVVQIDD